MLTKEVLSSDIKNYFDSVPLVPESWEPVVIKIESIIESLAALNSSNEINQEEYIQYIENVGCFINNGYSFLDNNKEILSQGSMKTLKDNTEILLANTKAIHSYLEVKNVISDFNQRKSKLI